MLWSLSVNDMAVQAPFLFKDALCGYAKSSGRISSSAAMVSSKSA